MGSCVHLLLWQGQETELQQKSRGQKSGCGDETSYVTPCQSKPSLISFADRTLNTAGRVGFNPQFVQPETCSCTHALMYLLHLLGYKAGWWGFQHASCMLYSHIPATALKQRERLNLILSQFKSAGLVVYSGVPSPIDRVKAK